MSDETLKITHLRLCECGLPAGHETLCRPSRHPLASRLDRQRADLNTERRTERHTKRRVSFAAERRERRAGTSTLDLYLEMLHGADRATTVAAGNTERSRGGGGDERVGPPVQQVLADDPRWQDATRIIRRRILQGLDILDEYLGTGHAGIVAAMDGHDKDRIILDEGRGLVAEEVVAELGTDYGSASYIRRLRHREGLDGRGYPRAEK